MEDLIIHLNPHSVVKEEQYILVLLMNSIHPQNQKRLLTLFTQVRAHFGISILGVFEPYPKLNEWHNNLGKR